MDVLILGGTGWLGRNIAATALAGGHRVTCLARGRSGAVADGATLVTSDRQQPDAYDDVRDRDWDAVVEISWQPGFVRAALDALGDRAGHWTYVSSGNVYADTQVRGADESASLLPALDGAQVRAGREVYGPAKVACEQASQAAVADRLLIARSGLIGGPGDEYDRVGYWVARSARDPDSPMLIPEPSECPSQVVDVRDLADWLVRCAVEGMTGAFNAVGPVQPLDAWIALSREIGGHVGQTVAAPTDWLVDNGVDYFMGVESMAMWLPGPDEFGFSDRDGSRADASGLVHRDRSALLADVLADERARGLDRPRVAGFSADYERELIDAVTAGRSPRRPADRA